MTWMVATLLGSGWYLGVEYTAKEGDSLLLHYTLPSIEDRSVLLGTSHVGMHMHVVLSFVLAIDGKVIHGANDAIINDAERSDQSCTEGSPMEMSQDRGHWGWLCLK